MCGRMRKGQVWEMLGWVVRRKVGWATRMSSRLSVMMMLVLLRWAMQVVLGVVVRRVRMRSVVLVRLMLLVVVVLGWRRVLLLLLSGQIHVVLLHLAHLLLELLVVCGKVGQLAVEVRVRCSELSDGRLACRFGSGEFLSGGTKVVLVVVCFVDGGHIGVVAGLLCCSMHRILNVVGLREAAF